MSKYAPLILLLTLCVHNAPAQDFKPLEFLAGEWTGEGTGAPGEGSGGFTFEVALGGKVMIRKSHADYPAAKDRPAYSHQDLTVVYPEAGAFKAMYFDNEGHVIRYAVQASADGAVFLSAPEAAQPRYRLTYRRAGPGRVTILFEIAPPGKPEEFKPYIRAAARRKQ